MRKLIWLLEIVLILVIIGLALLFLDRNESLVQLDLLLYQTGEIGLGTLVFIAFILGAFLGILVRIPDAIWRRVKNILKPSKETKSSKSGTDVVVKGNSKAT